MRFHGRLARWQVRSLWRRRSKIRVGEWAVTYVKQRKSWRMSCDIGKVMERLENKLWCRWRDGKFGEWALLSITSPTSQLILQPFCRFTYVKAHSPTLPLLHLHHSSFSNPSFASPTSQALHLILLASRPWFVVKFLIKTNQSEFISS